MKKTMEESNHVPFYVIGPLDTDIAPGCVYFTASIVSAILGWHGTAMLCCVMP